MSENGKATGGACPSFEEGVNVVAQQAAQNPVPSSLDAAIAAATARLSQLQSQIGHLSGMTAVSQPGGLGFTLPQAAGAYVPGFGLAISLGGGLPHGASLESLATSVAAVPATPGTKPVFTPPPRQGIERQDTREILRAPTLMLGDTLVDTVVSPQTVESKNSEPPTPMEPDNQLGLPEYANPVSQTSVAKPQSTQPETQQPQKPPEETPQESTGAEVKETQEPQGGQQEAKDTPPDDKQNTQGGQEAKETPPDDKQDTQGQQEAKETKPDDKQNTQGGEQEAQETPPDDKQDTQGQQEVKETKPEPSRKRKSQYEDGTYWKLRNYVKPNKKGECKASESVLKMMKTENGREELRKLLLEKGSLEDVEVHLSKSHMEKDSQKLVGGWHCKATLEKEGWTPEMIENSKKWAAQRGLVEKSEIHGEEEWRIPVHRSFEQEVVDQSESKQKVAFRTEDPDGELLSPVLDQQSWKSGGKPPEGPSPQVPNSNSSKSKSLPVLQANQDPFGLIPAFIDGIGKNLTSAEEAKERLETLNLDRATQLAKDMTPKITEMHSLYNNLLDTQQKNCIPGETSSSDKKDLAALFVKCTQISVVLNNFMSRARTIKPPKGTAPKAAASKSKSLKARREEQEQTGGDEDEEQEEEPKPKRKRKGKQPPTPEPESAPSKPSKKRRR